MKKIILAVVAGTMLLSNMAFASTTNTDKNSTVSSVNQNSWIHVDSTDPH